MYNPQLETFIRVADAGSFSKAAEEAFITPTAVIKQINILESSLGVKLFDRTHRGLTLTKAGRSLYQDTKYIIRCCKDSVTRAKNAMQEDMNVIRVGSSPMTPAQLLMELWSGIQQDRHPLCNIVQLRHGRERHAACAACRHRRLAERPALLLWYVRVRRSGMGKQAGLGISKAQTHIDTAIDSFL